MVYYFYAVLILPRERFSATMAIINTGFSA